MLNVLKICSINLSLLLAAAVAAEILFGTWFSKDPLDALAMPRNQAILVSGQGLFPGGEEFVYRRDRWGLRGAGEDPAKVTVLTMGGSTTNQLYLPEASTWQMVVQREFQAEGRDIRIANAGIDGLSTIGVITQLESWLPHVPGLKPRFILAYVGINDTHITGAGIDKLAHSSTNKWIRQHSALVRGWNVVVGAIGARKAKLNHHALDFQRAKWTDLPNGTEHRIDLEAYGQRLRRIVELGRAAGAEPIFVTKSRGDYRLVGGRMEGLAADRGPNGLDEYRMLSRMNEVTMAVCREQGLRCLDLASAHIFGEGDFYDRVHNTPQGAERLGRWLHDRLAPLI